MKRLLFLAISILMFGAAIAQQDATPTYEYQNSAQRLLSQNKGLTIGGYAQIDYNQPFGEDYRQNGNLDVHRLVMLFGYNFSDRLQFVSEIEYEHVKEVYIEQAFLQYKINDYINFRGGLMLIPMGIINEYHEPNTFNGVERPVSDKYIAPTTWREMGLGFMGNIPEISLRYQLYLMNGFNGYDGDAKFSGKNGLRKGRQKGAESYTSSPNFTGKVEYYGIKGLTLGLSSYIGPSQSAAYDGIEYTDEVGLAFADSTVVGINMIGADFRYNIKGWEFRGQLYYNALSNTDQYNESLDADLGSEMMSYYIEAGYDVFRPFESLKTQMIVFARYETFDTHHAVAGNTIMNDQFNKEVITTGIGWKLDPKVVLKADVQFFSNKSTDDYTKMFNAGIGLMF